MLIALILSMTACATAPLPEVSRALRDYPAEPYEEPADALELPAFEIDGATTVNGEEVAYLREDTFSLLEEFVEHAKANTQALRHRNRAWSALIEERDHLLTGGQLVEEQSAVYRALYVNQQRYCSFVQFASIGAAGLVLIATGL